MKGGTHADTVKAAAQAAHALWRWALPRLSFSPGLMAEWWRFVEKWAFQPQPLTRPSSPN